MLTVLHALSVDPGTGDRDGPVEISCRDFGDGETALVYLHSGWGYSIYPFERQVETLGAGFRVLAPDRSGYGRSQRRHGAMPLDFHVGAARETFGVLDALGVERAMLWGHSDGACIAAWMGLLAPERCPAIVLEAFHFEPVKPRSREFFETMVNDPTGFGERVSEVLAAEHGNDHWKEMLRLEGEVWLAIAEAKHDLYAGRLGELAPPVLILHGAGDPRTEPGEIESVIEALSAAEVCLLEDGRHCPHVEGQTWEEATAVATEFLRRHAPTG